jgi:hypothetical protein
MNANFIANQNNTPFTQNNFDDRIFISLVNYFNWYDYRRTNPAPGERILLLKNGFLVPKDYGEYQDRGSFVSGL